MPVRVRAGVIGGSSGAHPPSLELVFHQAICGPVGYAAYALPGSEPLARNIASVLSQGHDIAIMENHAVVCLGTDLSAACRRLESLELCARVIIEASGLGAVHHLGEEQLALAGVREPSLPELPLDGGGERSKAAESVARQEVCRFIDRGCRQRLFSSNEGTISRRLDERSFLITPVGYDRYEVTPEELVLVRDGRREVGKEPSGAEALHRYLYLAHPEVGAIILAQPPNLTAFCVSHTKLDTRLMPESFVFLGDVPLLPFGSQYRDPRAVAGSISRKQPVALIENECVLATGNDLLAAFDRLEVAELSAGSVLGAQAIGGVINITAKARQEITDTYVKD